MVVKPYMRSAVARVAPCSLAPQDSNSCEGLALQTRTTDAHIKGSTMQLRIPIRLLGTLLFLLISVSAQAQQKSLKELQDYFRKMQDGPFVLLEAPRTGLGVGTTYISTWRTTLYYTRPEDCFTSEILNRVTDRLAIPGENKITANVNSGVGLKVAGVGPITEPLALELKNSRATNIELTISELERKLLTVSELQGVFRKVTDEACVSAFDAKATPRRYIVVEALYAKSMRLAFKNDQGKDVSVSVGLLSKLFPKFNFGSKTTWTGAIDFANSPHAIAIKAVQVKAVAAMSGGSAIELEVAPVAAFYAGQ